MPYVARSRLEWPLFLRQLCRSHHTSLRFRVGFRSVAKGKPERGIRPSRCANDAQAGSASRSGEGAAPRRHGLWGSKPMQGSDLPHNHTGESQSVVGRRPPLRYISGAMNRRAAGGAGVALEVSLLTCAKG